MATFIGPARDRLLETRRSPYKPGYFICQACSRARAARGLKGLQPVRACRLWINGLNRPGVVCPTCGLAWVEQEEQPEAPQ